MQGFAFSYVLLSALAIALAVAAYTDIKRRQIDNVLNGTIALAAPLFWWASHMGLAEIGWQIGVALAALVVLAGLFAFGAMGGGDVKLLVALALWIKPAWYVQLLTIMAVAGGALTIAMAAWHVARRRKQKLAIPYGVAIAFGGLWVLGVKYLPAMQNGAALG